jgi:hypothetical protein
MILLDELFCSGDRAGLEKVSSDFSYDSLVSPMEKKNFSGVRKHTVSSSALGAKSPLAPGVMTSRFHPASKYVRMPSENSPLMGSWDQTEVD